MSEIKKIGEALENQRLHAKESLLKAIDLSTGLYTTWKDIELEMIDEGNVTWWIPDTVILRLQSEIDQIRKVRAPKPILLTGKFRALYDDGPPKESTDRLQKAAEEQENFIKILEQQASLWHRLADKYNDAADRIESRAGRMLEGQTKSWIIYVINVYTGALSSKGQELMYDVLPVLQERAVSAKQVARDFESTARTLRQDLRDFRNGIELKIFLEPTYQDGTQFEWEKPGDLVIDRGVEVQAAIDSIRSRTVDALAHASRVQAEADAAARREGRIARFQNLAGFVTSLTNLSSALAKADADGVPRPTTFESNGQTFKVPHHRQHMFYTLERTIDGVHYELVEQVEVSNVETMPLISTK